MPICPNCDFVYLDGEAHDCPPRRLWWNASMLSTPPAGQVLIAYLVAPLGAAVVAFAVSAIDFFTREKAPPSFQPASMVMTGVVIAYVVGLLLLPLFAVFARFRWLGLRYYLPAAVVISVVLAAFYVPRSPSPALVLLLFTTCGAACAVVFSFVVSVKSL